MARLSTAAAGLAWAAILLMCAALVAGQQGGLFIKNTLPPPVRIYSREDSTLNIAVSEDGRVVLARGSCSDRRQQWIMVPGAPTRPGSLPFALQNLATGQVITIPSRDGRVGLSPRFDPTKGADALLQDLWKQEEPRREDGFAPLFVNKDKKFKLVAQRNQNGRIGVGSPIMISSTASATAINAIWQLTSYPPCIDLSNPIPNPNPNP